jgi:hypothetical protein
MRLEDAGRRPAPAVVKSFSGGLTRAPGFVRLAALSPLLRLEGASWMNSTVEWDFPMTS